MSVIYQNVSWDLIFIGESQDKKKVKHFHLVLIIQEKKDSRTIWKLQFIYPVYKLILYVTRQPSVPNMKTTKVEVP